MIRVTRRRVLLVVLALFFIGAGTIAWTLAGLPPLRFYLRHGLDPYCEPTGEKVTLEGVQFIEIGPGIFRMGSNHLAEGGDWLGRFCAPLGLPWGKHPQPSNEMPVHWVEFRRGFWIATTEITNAQFERFRPESERNRQSQWDATPVVDVSWRDARAYCDWLSDRSTREIRLPTEAEWECACRAGSDDEFAFGNDEAKLAEYAWFLNDLKVTTRTIAKNRPNRWGLFDLHGNVWEWCEDKWHDSYDEAPTDGAPSTDDGSLTAVSRGGGWRDPAVRCRSASRSSSLITLCSPVIGFRPAFVLPED